MSNGITFDGFDRFADSISELSSKATAIMKRATYEGAKIGLDDVRKAIEALPIEYYGPNATNVAGVLPVQKEGLLDGLGATEMKDENGKVFTVIGFDGYNGLKTKRFPQGQPNLLVARGICSGTSFRKRNDFISKIARQKLAEIQKTMAEQIEKDTKKIMKG